MSGTLENLSEKASQRISQLVENWGVDREKLLEEFENIYESVTKREDLDFSSEEERQKFTVEKLSVQVAVEREGFLTEDGERARIRVLKGRRNFTCPYLEENHPESRYKSCQN